MSVAAHWQHIDPERMARYREMFRWNPASANLYDPAAISPGHLLADFGCGPGHAAVEFARWVGPDGHVHAMDVNAEFVAMARQHATEAGMAARVTAHLLDDGALPLPDAALDRVLARNTVIYVDDPAATLAEFHRVLRPGGVAHMIEGDWRLTVAEPVPAETWERVVAAAAWAWPHPRIGRQLMGIARRCGFAGTEVRVVVNADTTGRLMGMIRTVVDYAREGGMDAATLADVQNRLDAGLENGTYLVVAPQFMVTARRSGSPREET